MKIFYSNGFWFLLISLGWLSCANIVSPTGGPKDTTAPHIKKRSLIDSAVNFKGGTISFDFDEFVQLKDIQNQLIVTPILKTNPKIAVHKRRVSIQIPDSLLEQNTTYSISLGNSIQDIKESNPYQQLNFIFSTGPYFDSLSLQGKVFEANTGKADTACSVVLYPANLPDSAFFKQKPLYIQKVQNGLFFFKNLPNKAFKIFALQDQNKNLRYDLVSERIAFYNKEVHTTDSATIQLYSFIEEEKIDSSIRSKQRPRNISEKKPGSVAGKESTNGLPYFVNADTVNKSKRTFDINDSLMIRFNVELKNIDLTKIRIYQDSILDASALIKLDSSRKKIILTTQWTEDALYKVMLLKGFAQDSSGLQAMAGQFYFKTKRKSDYGFLTLQCKQNENDIIELHLNDKIIARKNAKDSVVNFPLLLPATYQISIHHDENKNGIWDTGSLFHDKHQPETVELFPADIIIKANWENKVDIKTVPSKKPSSKK